MATTFYLAYNLAAAISPDFGAGWDAAEARRWQMNTTKQATTLTAVETSVSVGGTQPLAVQFIGPALAAQTIPAGSTIQGYMLCEEDNTGSNCFLAFRVAKCNAAGDTVTEIHATTFPNAAGHEFVLDTATNRYITDSTESATISLAEMVFDEGDRLIIEIGCSESTGSGTRNFTQWFGDAGSSDLPGSGDLTSTDQSLNPWIQFSANLSFAAGGRTTKNTRSHPLGIAAGVNFRVARGTRLALPDRTLWLPNRRAA